MIQKPIVINIESESGIKITKIYINIFIGFTLFNLTFLSNRKSLFKYHDNNHLLQTYTSGLRFGYIKTPLQNHKNIICVIRLHSLLCKLKVHVFLPFRKNKVS